MEQCLLREHLVFDAEWSGGFHTPKEIHCIVICDVDNEEVVSYHGKPDYRLVHGVYGGSVGDGVRQLAASSRLVGHNILSADLPVLKKLHNLDYEGDCVDTLVLSKLLNPDRPRPWGLKGVVGPHSIEAWAVRLGNPDEQKVKVEQWDVFTQDMLDRCIKDVLINLSVYKSLYKECSG